VGDTFRVDEAFENLVDESYHFHAKTKKFALYLLRTVLSELFLKDPKEEKTVAFTQKEKDKLLLPHVEVLVTVCTTAVNEGE